MLDSQYPDSQWLEDISLEKSPSPDDWFLTHISGTFEQSQDPEDIGGEYSLCPEAAGGLIQILHLDVTLIEEQEPLTQNCGHSLKHDLQSVHSSECDSSSQEPEWPTSSVPASVSISLSPCEQALISAVCQIAEERSAGIRNEWIRASDAEENWQRECDCLKAYIAILERTLITAGLAIPDKLPTPKSPDQYHLEFPQHESQMYL
ncbi:hypothetical protein ARMGADRAFT_1085649 [Armillaria gallica]|uniref:Uncharacterized protein n=1 Tax=Armillaria gallica TaxID=47427 RepID=A0A2H3CW29_ARMGA|nr:hypothetical protein ARMGADRAFT_1085649 [Armillaria gallica]